ncbi:cytochrome p450 [Moniliophthora roreri]|nr:cytochrome p450 [Moniliophthora roreri]
MTQALSMQFFAWATLVAILLYHLKQKLWAHPFDNIPGPRATSWVKGHFLEIFGMEGWDFHATMGRNYGPTSSFHSLLGEKQLYTFDPRAVHQILVKDDKSYDEPVMFLYLLGLIFGPNVMSTSLGHQHRKQRRMLNPAFSPAHLKDLTPVFYEVGRRLQKTLASKVNDGPQEIDVLSWMGRTGLELLGRGGLGYSFDNMENEHKPHPFAEAMKSLFPILGRLAWAQYLILPYAMRVSTPSLRRFVSRWLPWKDFQEARAVSNSIWGMSKSIYEDRKRALAEDGVSETDGRDILSLMMKENMNSSSGERLREEEMIGQMAVLIFAGTDTASSELTKILELLAERPDVQRRLRTEIEDAFEHGDAPYEVLVSLPYLDAVIRETLRMYPPVSKLSRTTRQDTILPLSVPIKGKDGSIITEIPIMKNTEIQISIMNLNRNPALWGEDANEWNPGRWLKPLLKTVTDANLPGVYPNLMSFSTGERFCIGFRYALLEMKVVLALLVRIFDFSPTQKKIFWKMTGVASPMVIGEDDERPQLPLVMGLVQRA